MATLVFVLFWILLGGGLLYVALSGGPGGARKRLGRQSRRGRRLALGGFLVALVVLGFGVPAAVIATVNSRTAVPEANISNLTAQEERGRELFGRQCRNCHTLRGGNAVAQVGPNLDDLRPPRDLVVDAIREGRARGNGQMAADLVEGDDVEAVAAFVTKAVGQTQEP